MAQTARLEQARAAAQAAHGFGSAEHLAALEDLRRAKIIATGALLARHETIAGYAQARFATLPPAREGVEAVPDYMEFTTIEAVEAAYARAERRLHEAAFARDALLPPGQPLGLAAFAPGSTVISSWRHFEMGDGASTDCIVSFCETGEKLHFCLAHRWGAMSGRSNEHFRRIATLLARQTIIFALPEAAEIFEAGRHRLARHLAQIRAINALAARLNFYRHLWPHRRMREEFSRVEMLWDGASLIDPDWSAEIFGVLPAALRDASGQFPETEPLLLANYSAAGAAST